MDILFSLLKGVKIFISLSIEKEKLRNLGDWELSIVEFEWGIWG